MEISSANNFEGDFSSNVVHSQATSEPQEIKFYFPSLFDYTKKLVTLRAVLIDRVVINYRHIAPFSSTGRVRISLYDTRLNEHNSKQAEFVFPILCHCDAIFYSNSHFSSRETDCPWKAYYSLEDSNLMTTSRFCQIKANLKMTSSKSVRNITIKMPEIIIRSPEFKNTDVDVWHVSRAENTPAICRSTSSSHLYRSIPRVICPGPGSSLSMVQYSRHSTAHIEDLDDPGKSVSQVGSDNGVGQQQIVLPKEQFAEVLSTVATAVKEGLKDNHKPILPAKNKATF